MSGKREESEVDKIINRIRAESKIKPSDIEWLSDDEMDYMASGFADAIKNDERLKKKKKKKKKDNNNKNN